MFLVDFSTHSTHQEHVSVMRGENLEIPHIERSLACVAQVDMGPRYHM
jgi:hypothetical protein